MAVGQERNADALAVPHSRRVPAVIAAFAPIAQISVARLLELFARFLDGRLVDLDAVLARRPSRTEARWRRYSHHDGAGAEQGAAESVHSVPPIDRRLTRCALR